MKFLRIFNLRQLRRQPIRLALGVAAIAAGLSLVIAVAIVAASIQHAIGLLGDDLAGVAPLRVLGPMSHGGLDEATVDEIRVTPGVASAVPVVQTVVEASGRTGTIPILALGVDCSVQDLIGNIGCDEGAVAGASADRPPFVSGALLDALGPAPSIRTDVGVIPLDAAPALPQLDEVNAGRIAIFPLPQAQEAFVRPGRVDAAYVTLDGSADAEMVRMRLEQRLGLHVRVQSADDSLPGTDQVGFLLPLLGLVALVTVSVGGLLVYNITRLSVEERRKELAIVSALGAPSRLVRFGALAEAALVGMAGGLGGLVIGFAIAHPMVRALSRDVERQAGAHVGVHLSAGTVGASVLCGALLGVAAAWAPARRSVRLDVVSELHHGVAGEASPRRAFVPNAVARTMIGVIGIGLGWLAQRDGGLSTAAPTLSYVSVVITSAGLIAAVAAWTPLVVGFAANSGHRLGTRAPTVRLALTNLSRQPRQTAAMATALAAAVALATGLGNFVPANRAGVASSYGALADGRVFVSTLSVSNSALVDSKVSALTLANIRTLPGVADVDRTFYVSTQLSTASFSVSAYEGIDEPFEVYRGRPAEEVLADGEAMIGPALARSEALDVGSMLEVPTPRGFEEIRVGGIWATPSDSGSSATVSPQTHLRLFGSQPALSAFVRPVPGVSPAELRDQILDAGIDPGLHVLTAEQYTAQLADEVERFLAPFWTLQRLLLVVALVATTSTMLLVGVQRRRELGVLASVGLGPRRLGRMTIVEGGILGAVGSCLGVLAGLGITVVLTEVAGVLFGVQPPLRIDPLAAGVYAALGVGVVVVGVLWPARLSSRTPILEALRYE